jgi:chemotaxis protein CheD
LQDASDWVTAYLHAGQLFASVDPCTITTIVGSCVTVCLYDPVRRIGGANHYLLSEAFGELNVSARFGNVAIPQLIARVVSLGSCKSDLVAKVFGGANTNGGPGAGNAGLGAKNVQLAKRILSRERIPIAAEDVLGSRGRKIIFHTAEGSAWVRSL